MNDRYDAFISYAHSADGLLAPRLQEGLQTFAKPWNKRRALRVFRDDASLSANPDLWSSIETALLGSRWLILLASPPSATSQWVEREVDAWCRNKPPENILIALTDGDIRWDSHIAGFDATYTSSLPAAARAAFRLEPRVVDLRWTRAEDASALTLRDQRFSSAVADLAAPLHNLPKDELIGEDRKQHRKLIRWRRTMVTGLALLTVVSLVSSFFALGQRDRARDRAAIALSRQLAAQSAELRDDSPALSALLAVEAYRKTPTPEAYRSLVAAANHGSIATVLHGESIYGTQIAVATGANMATYSRDGRLAAASGLRGEVTIWDVRTGRATAVLQTSAYTSQIAFSAARTLVAYDPGVAYTTFDIDKPAAGATQWLSPPDGVMSSDGSTIVANEDQSPELTITNASTRAGVRLTFPVAVTAFGVRADGAEIVVASGGRLQWFDRGGKLLGSAAAPASIDSSTLTISDDGRTIASFGEENTSSKDPLVVYLTDTATGSSTAVKTELTVHHISRFAPDNVSLAIADYTTVQVVDVKARKATETTFAVPGAMIGLAFRPDVSQLLVPTREGESYVFDVTAHHPLARILTTEGVVAAANVDRTRLAVLSDRSVTVLDGATGEVVGRPIALDVAPPDDAPAVAINAAGDAIAIFWKRRVAAYDVKSGDRIGSAVSTDCDRTDAVTFDGRVARIFHAPEMMTVVDLARGRQERNASCPTTDARLEAAVDPIGRYVVFGEEIDDGHATKLTWWDVERNRLISKELDVRGDGAYAAPIVSPGGRFILTLTTLQFQLRVFDLRNDPPTIGAIGAFSFLGNFSFSDDGSLVALADKSTFSMFDVEQRSSVALISDLPGLFNTAVMGPGGRSAIATEYGRVADYETTNLVMIDLRPETMVDVACRFANRNLTDDERRFYLGTTNTALTCPQFPREFRSLQQRTDIPVISASVVTTVRSGGFVTTTSRSGATTASPSSTRPPTSVSTTRQSTSSVSTTRPSTTTTTSVTTTRVTTTTRR